MKTLLASGRALIAAMVVSLLLIAGPAEADHDGVVMKHGRYPAELVSLTSSGAQGDGHSGSACDQWDGASMSDGGRFVAFTSSARLDPADVNGSLLTDVYVRDRKKGTTELVSQTDTGLAPPIPDLPDLLCVSWSFNPAISSDGRYVAFASRAALTDDVEQSPYSPTSGVNVYLRDLKKEKTELVSPAFDNQPQLGNSGLNLITISRNGRYVVFTSNAGNLMEAGTCQNGPILTGCQYHVYARDRRENKTILVSRAADGTPGNDGSTRAAINDAGRFIVFESLASNLTDNDLNNCLIYGSLTPTSPSCKDVFIYDLEKDRTELISVSRDGDHSANMNSWLMDTMHGQPISADGRFVVYETTSSDVVPVGMLGETKIIVHDRKTGRSNRVSVNSSGQVLNGVRPSLSDNGRYISFGAHICSALIGPCEFHGYDQAATFVHDTRTGQTDLVRRFDGKDQDGDRLPDVLEGSSRFIVWTSGSDGVADNDTNGSRDVFILPLGKPGLGVGDARATGSITAPGDEDGKGPASLIEISDRAHDVVAPTEGADLLGARLVYRPGHEDLFARIEVGRLPVVSGLGIPIAQVLYRMTFDIGGRPYELRATASPAGIGFTADIGLFDCAHDPCEEIAKLAGSYGTAGESILAAIPTGLLGGGTRTLRITNVGASSDLGTYMWGSIRTLDKV